MLRRWLQSLSEEHLLTWSNRGQLRRARKLLAMEDGGAEVALAEDGASGRIDGHEQSLSAVGFDALACSCPATGQCHHLVAFLLVLHELAVEQAAPDAAEDAGPQTPYWRVTDEGELLRALGRANVRAAERVRELPPTALQARGRPADSVRGTRRR